MVDKWGKNPAFELNLQNLSSDLISGIMSYLVTLEKETGLFCLELKLHRLLWIESGILI